MLGSATLGIAFVSLVFMSYINPGSKIVEKIAFCTSQAAYGVTADGRIVFWNEAAERAFGYTQSQALGQSCWKLLQGQDTFDNVYCGQSCPIRTAAIRGAAVNPFQLHFMRKAEQRKKFKLTTLTLCANNDERVMVNLCDPISEPHINHGKKLSRKGARRRRLTPRQTEVLKLLSEGKTATDIAANMGISVFTVSNHTQQVRLKLNAKTRIEAVAVGHKLGLI